MKICRRCSRWQAGTPAKIKLERSDNIFECTLKDISLLGMKISMDQKLSLDTFQRIRFFLSDDCVLDLEVWVVWHKAVEELNFYGLYFTQIQDPDKEKIYQFMRRNFPQEINKHWWKGYSEEKGGEEMEDRRIFDRFRADLPLRYIDPRENHEGQGRTFDLNAKGIGLVANEDLPVHTPLEMWLVVPDKGEPLYTRGEVVWSRKTQENNYRIGVELERADLMGISRVMRAVSG